MFRADPDRTAVRVNMVPGIASDQEIRESNSTMCQARSNECPTQRRSAELGLQGKDLEPTNTARVLLTKPVYDSIRNASALVGRHQKSVP